MRSSLEFRGWRPVVGVVAIGLVAFGLSLRSAPAGDNGRASADQNGRVAYNDTAEPSADGLAAPPSTASGEPTEVSPTESVFAPSVPKDSKEYKAIQDRLGRAPRPGDIPEQVINPLRATNEDRVEPVVATGRVTGPAGAPRCTGAFCTTTKAIGAACSCNAECNDELICNGEERCEGGICVAGSPAFPNSTGGCLEQADMPGGSIPGNLGNRDRCQPGVSTCDTNSFSACVEPEVCREVTCTSQYCIDNYCAAGGDCSNPDTRMFCFAHPGGDLAQRCVDDATKSLAAPNGPGTCTLGTDCPSGTCITDFPDELGNGFCACDSDAQCVNNDCNEATRTCRTTGYECDFSIIPGDPGAGDCSLVIGTCCIPGALPTDAPSCSGETIVDCNTLGGTWTSDLESNRNNTDPLEVGCLNNCARYRSGVRGPGQGNAVGGGVPGSVDIGPVVDVPCNTNGFESIGDDYVLAGGQPIVLERFSFTGGTDSGGTVVFQFYDTAMNLAAELDLGAGAVKGTRTYGDRQNPLYLGAGANQPIIPAAGFIVMKSPTFGSHGTRDSQGHWFTTEAPVDIGANDPTKMWINGVFGDQSAVVGAGNQVLSFELRGVPLADTVLRTPGGAEACCDPAGTCSDTLPWLCSTCSSDGSFCTRDRDCWRCTGDGTTRCWSDEQCANQGLGTCNAAPTCGGASFQGRRITCQQDADCPESSPGAGDATCVFYANALALPSDEFPAAGFCLNKCNASPCADGACCLPDGTCVIETSQASCEALPGTWQGFGETCDPNCCPTTADQGGDFCWQATPYVLSVPTAFNEKIVQTITTSTADSVVGAGTGPIGGQCEFLTCSSNGARCMGAEGSACDGGLGTCEHKPCAWQAPEGHPLACASGTCQSDPTVHCRSAGDCPLGVEGDACQGFEVCERLDCGDPNVPSLGWRVSGSDPVKWESFTLNSCARVTIDYCCTDANPNTPDGAASPSNRFFDTCEGSPSRPHYCEGLSLPDFPAGTQCTTDAECLAGACSISGTPCHGTDECPLGTCSTTTTQGCRIDGDCPAGETCTNPETCTGGQQCEPLRDFCGPLDQDVVEREFPDPNGTQSSFGWKCGGGDSNWAQIWELPAGTYYVPIRALRTCTNGGTCFSDADCIDGGICQIHEHEYQMHITTEKCVESACCRLGEVCEGTDVNNPNNRCLDSTAGQCENSLAACSTDFDCAPGVCTGASGDPCTSDTDCTRTFPDSVPGFAETCLPSGTCGIPCHQSYEGPIPDPLGFNCPIPELCAGFERCILNDCPESVCSDDPGGAACASDADCTAGACSVSGNPCHSDVDCAPGGCSGPPVALCRNDDECPTPFITCTVPPPETCIGGATCDPHQCTPDHPLCDVTDRTNCEANLKGFWKDGTFLCEPPGTPVGENTCFIGACCTDDTVAPCKDDTTFNNQPGCAGFGGSSKFVPGATCAADPCPVCEIQSQANCQVFDVSTGFISRCDMASGTTIPNWRCADDFVSATNGELNRVCWWPAFAPVGGNPECSQPGEAPADTFRVRVYPDLGHIPDEGNELGPIGGQPLNIDVKAPILGRVWEYSAPLDTPIILTANECYWLEITGEGTSVCDVFWSTSNRGNNHAMQDFNFPDFGRYTSEDAANADFAWCVNTGIVSTSNIESGCPDVTGACCACGVACQATTQDACATVTGTNGFTGKWKIYRRCDIDGNGLGEGLKCQADADCPSGQLCKAPEGGQCGVDPCGGTPANDDCVNAFTVTHAGAHCAGDQLTSCDVLLNDCAGATGPCVPDDINDVNNNPTGLPGENSVLTDIRCATTDGPATSCGTNPGDLSFDVWFNYTAPVCGTLTVQNCNTLPIYDGFGAIYRKSDFTPGSECADIIAGSKVDAACNDDGCGAGGPWLYSLDVAEGEELIIRMGGWFDDDPANYARAVDEGSWELHLDPGVGQFCAAPVGDPLPIPNERRKNRYISFDPNKAENDGTNVAFKVELTAITLGSCNGGAGSPAELDFCREDRGADDCNTCAGAPAGENSCINQAIDCGTNGTCTPTGETCVNDAPNSGGSNVGTVWWVGPEQNGIHLLVSAPFRLESANWPNPVNVGDCEVVPEATYKVTAVVAADETESTGSVSLETTLFAGSSSSWWADCVGPLKKFCGGDINGTPCAVDADCTAPETCDRAWTLPDGAVNFDDVNAALSLVAPGPNSVPANLMWVDLHGNASGTPGSQAFDPPNFVPNFADIGQILSGFGGFPYKGYDPKDCPDTSSWP